MITDFEILKKQLTELAKVVNSFKSEAVQLKVTELVLTGQVVPASSEGRADIPEDEGEAGKKKIKKKTKKKVKKAKKGKDAAKRRLVKVGPATVLTELIGNGYFKQPRTIGDIIAYADQKKARKLVATELSGPLARFVRNNKLKRDKNKDGQYEYTKA